MGGYGCAGFGASRIRWILCSALGMTLLVVAQAAYASAVSLERSADCLTVEQARLYMVDLINRDRASAGLPPVALDDTATEAAQIHTNEMAQWSYLSHWDLRGRKPDQRYSELGGQGAVFENVYTDHTNPFLGEKVPLGRQLLVTRRELEQAEAWLFNQRPPNDRHRRNILDPNHKLVGIGVSVAFDRILGRRLTLAQEFVRAPGEFAALPADLSGAQEVKFTGRLKKGFSLRGIQICREELPADMHPDQLNRTGCYYLPDCTVAIFRCSGSATDAALKVSRGHQGEEFSLSLKPGQSWKEGLYYVIVWVSGPAGEPFIGSTRTTRFTVAQPVHRLAEAGACQRSNRSSTAMIASSAP
ncbi:MAG TPA: CAP domain-containing protein [Candidatus Obscuribacterales bacterium]